MSADFENLVAQFDKFDVYEYLIELDLKLNRNADAESPLDYNVVFRQLTRLINVFCDTRPEALDKGKSKQQEMGKPVPPEVASQFSISLFALLSRNLVTVLTAIPNKVYDTANNLLPYLTVDENGDLSLSGQVASTVLISVFEHFPNHLSALINFAATQLYKILKKNLRVNCNVVYLLSVVLKAAVKSDIDDKFQAKWVKLLSKAITQNRIEVPASGSEASSENAETSIALVEYYISSMKSILILSVASNYQQLLDVSTSSSGTKMKPEAILSSQNQFQIAILAAHEKLFQFGFQSQFKEIRAAMVDMLANLLSSFVETGKFSPIDYLIELYPMPDMNLWDSQLAKKLSSETENFFESKKDSGIVVNHDSTSIIQSNTDMLLLQIGCVETIVVYVQLLSLQDWDFFPSYICKILDSILVSFGDLALSGHVQNQQWSRTLDQWLNVVKFLVREGGATVHEILAIYVVQKLTLLQVSSAASDEGNLLSSKASRRQSSIFSFKYSRKSKSKGPINTSITPFHNPYQMKLILQIIELLLPYGVDFDSLAYNKNIDEESSNESQNESDDEIALAEEKDSDARKRNNYISDLLLSLICNENQYIRNYGLSSLLKYAEVNFSESNQLTLSVFQAVSQIFNVSETSKEPAEWANQTNMASSVNTKLLGYSLALSALIKQSDTTVLQNSTIAKILSFCTQNLKHNSNIAKRTTHNAACWIALSAIVTYYPDSEFVKLNSSQFLVFWKSLLTSQFISSDISGTENGSLNEIVSNLKLRSLSIICLLNYINSVAMSPDLSKQLQFLLVKAHKYLIYLESNLAAVGGVTSFNPQQFNESEFNPNMINNLIFSNFNDSKALPIENQLISLILYNKKVILQGFLRLSSSLKSDVNSSLVVLLFKIFAEPKAFSRLQNKDVTKEKTKSSKGKSNVSIPAHENKGLLLLDDEQNYNFGVTSKFNSEFSAIDELHSEFEIVKDSSLDNNVFSVADFGISSMSNEAPEGPSTCWLDIFENALYSPSSHNVNHDPASFLQHAYSIYHTAPTDLITSLVDLSIEVFQRVFPNLSFKIQFSLLEQLRAAVSAKNIDPFRKRALQVNISVALHGLSKNLVKTKNHLDEQLVSILIQTIEQVSVPMNSLVSISADTIGLATTLLPKQKSEEIVSRYVNDIVNDTDPFTRGMLLLSLSKICQHSQVGVSETFNVISQLIVDPHPVISFYSVSAAANVMENSIGNNTLSKSFIEMAHAKLLSNSGELCLSNSVAPNLLAVHNVMERVTHLLKLCITSLGPTLKDANTALKQQLKHLVISISYGIGCSNMTDYVSSLKNLLGIFQEIVIFDFDLISGLPQWIHALCNRLITSNVKTGVGILSPTSVSNSTAFPLTTSQDLYDDAYACIVEMTKLGLPTLTKESLSLAWISMELRPSPSLKELISFWIDSQVDVKWFSQLSTLFKISRKKLVGAFLTTNYQRKLVPSSQRRKKSVDNGINFQDEEVQNIVNEDSAVEEKNEHINWEFKIFVYGMLIKLLSSTETSKSMTEELIPRIQEIVRMSFVGTTSPILAVKLKGVELLDKTLSLFGEMEDPLYPSVSILEQQQAQIISALIPCFGADSDANVMVHAINVSSKFVNLPRIKFYSKERILKTLAFLLEEISSNKFLKFVSLEDMAEYGRKAVQLAILNCWAVLKINLEEQEGLLEPDFQNILDKYSTLLTSLWILALKDLSTIKYSSPNLKEIKLYSTYWLNFVGILSLELEKNHQAMSDILKEEEGDFFFVLFCQCAESLIKNQSVPQVLLSVNRLLQVKDLVSTLFNDEIFGEVIDLVDRLVLMEDDSTSKCEVLDTVKILFVSYISMNETWPESDNQKLLELLRVAMLPLFQTYPFLRQDFNADDAAHQLLLAHCKYPSQIALLKKSLSVVVTMVQSFNSLEEKEDLLSCLLFIFAKFYNYGDDTLISVILPYLKMVIDECSSLSGSKLPSRFLNILRGHRGTTTTTSEANHILTYMVLLTAGDVELNSEEVDEIATVLVKAVSNPDIASTAIQSIKSLIRNLSPIASSSFMVVKSIVTILLKELVHGEDFVTDAKIALEIVYLVSQSEAVDNEEKRISMFSILVPLIAKFEESGKLNRAYLHDRVLSLLNSDPNAFKAVVNEHLNEKQKRIVEDLVKLSKTETSGVDSEEDEIELKIFG